MPDKVYSWDMKTRENFEWLKFSALSMDLSSESNILGSEKLYQLSTCSAKLYQYNTIDHYIQTNLYDFLMWLSYKSELVVCKKLLEGLYCCYTHFHKEAYVPELGDCSDWYFFSNWGKIDIQLC